MASQSNVNVKPVPDGYSTVTPYLNLKDADKFIEFAKKAFGAEERARMLMPGGKIGHAEIKIGDSIIMLSEAAFQPHKPGSFFLYVNDVDAAFERAKKAGCTVDMPVDNQFWGDRFGRLSDSFGNGWAIATHVEDVAPAEMERRSVEAMKKMGEKK